MRRWINLPPECQTWIADITGPPEVPSAPSGCAFPAHLAKFGSACLSSECTAVFGGLHFVTPRFSIALAFLHELLRWISEGRKLTKRLFSFFFIVDPLRPHLFPTIHWVSAFSRTIRAVSHYVRAGNIPFDGRTFFPTSVLEKGFAETAWKESGGSARILECEKMQIEDKSVATP